MRRKPLATSAASAIDASTALAFILPDEQALPAETAIPARSNWTSSDALGRAGKRDGTDRRNSRAIACDNQFRPRPLTPLFEASRANKVMSDMSYGLAASAAAKASRRRRVLGTAPIAFFLPPDRFERREVTHEKGAHARGATKLVCAGGNEVGVGQRKFPRALRTIGEQQRSRPAYLRREPTERLNNSGFIIHMLNCYQRRTGCQDGIQFLPRRSGRLHQPG